MCIFCMLLFCSHSPLPLYPLLYCVYSLWQYIWGLNKGTSHLILSYLFIVLAMHTLWTSCILFHCTFAFTTNVHVTNKPLNCIELNWIEFNWIESRQDRKIKNTRKRQRKIGNETGLKNCMLNQKCISWKNAEWLHRQHNSLVYL